jgi:hypothetical protein
MSSEHPYRSKKGFFMSHAFITLFSHFIDLLNCSKRSALPCDVVRVVPLVCSETQKKRLGASQSIPKNLHILL